MITEKGKGYSLTRNENDDSILTLSPHLSFPYSENSFAETFDIFLFHVFFLGLLLGDSEGWSMKDS